MLARGNQDGAESGVVAAEGQNYRGELHGLGTRPYEHQDARAALPVQRRTHGGTTPADGGLRTGLQ
jgi:hypothetical protein